MSLVQKARIGRGLDAVKFIKVALFVALIFGNAVYAGEGRPLFNGNDLKDWVAEGGKEFKDKDGKLESVWSVRDGMLHCQGQGFGFLRYTKEEFGDFDSYCWRFVDGRPKLNRWKTTREIPASTPESETFSKDLKRRRFSFVGPTVIYAYMQAIGMVNDHIVVCFRHGQISQANPR